VYHVVGVRVRDKHVPDIGKRDPALPKRLLRLGEALCGEAGIDHQRVADVGRTFRWPDKRCGTSMFYAGAHTAVGPEWKLPLLQNGPGKL
jgi:hypothetical protein